MREKDLTLVGLIAMCVVSTVALVRLVAVLRIFRRHRGYDISSRSNRSTAAAAGTNGEHRALSAPSSFTTTDRGASSQILVSSLVFHVLVFLCLVTEVPVYACRYEAALHPLDSDVGVGRPLYALHLTSYLLLFSAFCVIVTLWSDVAVFEPNEWTVLMNRSMLVLCFFYLVVTIVAVGVCLGLGSVKHFFSSVAFLLFCAYSIAALLLLGSCFLVLGCLLQRRICRVLVTGSCTARLTARVVRLNVVMLACFICFTMRAFMLAALVQVQSEGEAKQIFGKGWKKWEWDMRIEWAPHVIPCFAMLYLMRNAGESTPGEQGREVGDSGERAELARGAVESGGGLERKGASRTFSSYGSYNST